MANVTISYKLTPPAAFDTTTSPSSASAVLSYPIGTATSAQQLAGIQSALGEGRERMNEILTEWKVAVGALEPGKQATKKKLDAEEDEEEE